MAQCPYCGTTLDDNATRCPSCNSPISQEDIKEKSLRDERKRKEEERRRRNLEYEAEERRRQDVYAAEQVAARRARNHKIIKTLSIIAVLLVSLYSINAVVNRYLHYRRKIMGTLVLNGPQTSRWYVNRLRRGHLPDRIKLKQGIYTVKVVDDELGTWMQQVEIKAQRVTTPKIRLVKAPELIAVEKKKKKKKKMEQTKRKTVTKAKKAASKPVQRKQVSSDNGMQPVSSSVGKPKVDLNKVNEAANNFILGFAAACEQYSYDPVAPYVDESAEQSVKNMISSSRNAKFIYGKVLGSQVNNERHTAEALVWIKMGYNQAGYTSSTNDFAYYLCFPLSEPYKVIGFSTSGLDTAGGLFCKGMYNFVVTQKSEVCGEPGGTVIGKVGRGTQVYAAGQMEAGGRIWIWGNAGGYGISMYHDGIGWAWFPADCLAKKGL